MEIGNIIYKSSWDEIKQAGEEEKRIARECGDVDSDGISMCTSAGHKIRINPV